MTEQVQVPVENIRGYGSDIKSSLQFIVTRIILDAYKARDSKNPMQLQQWGAVIETLHAFVSNYYEPQYLLEVKKIRVDLERNQNDFQKVFRLYNRWFSLICRRLGKFRLLPPVSTSYAQGIGVVNYAED